ncbi:MAG: hypothetical protein J2P57_20815, partial [Acidimicrobiaceae bacterium]|nr:hypothetical protein [Acidimicrobiaceae bacterium]
HQRRQALPPSAGRQAAPTPNAVPLPALSLEKRVVSAVGPILSVGQRVTYEYTVTNTGNTIVSELRVHDFTIGNDATCLQSVLALGESITCVDTYIVTAADVARGSVTNSAAAGGASQGIPVNSNLAMVTIPMPSPMLPTSKAQCMHGGWMGFVGSNGERLFRNQGDCVSFVATGGRNGPSG